jgi:cation transport ATPase
MVGKFLESRARRDAGDAVRALVARQPDRAWLLRDAIELRERTLDGRGAVVAMHSADVEDDLPKRGLLGAGG